MNKFLILLFSLTTTYSAKAQITRPEEFHSKYKLAKVMMMGRHHVRSGAITNREHRVTPHEWHQWEVEEGNLTQRGALLEEQMGIFFNLWLSKEQLLGFSDPSSADSVHIYANSMERTIETGRNFAKGLMPGKDLQVVYNTSVEMGKMDPVFNTVSSKTSDVLKKKANAEIDLLCGEGGLREAISQLEQDAEVMADIIDMTSSTGCLEANACSFHFDNPYISLSRNAMPKIQGGNLYSRGAAFGALFKSGMVKGLGDYFYLAEDCLRMNVGVEAVRAGKDCYHALLDAGTKWYDAVLSEEFLLESGNEIELVLTPLNGGGRRTETILLRGLPERPPGTTRIRLTLTMDRAEAVSCRVEDLGFGAIFPSSGLQWTGEVNVI